MYIETIKRPTNNEDTSSLDKAAFFNHIKKHHLCSDKNLIKYFSKLEKLSLDNISSDLKIELSQLEASKEELEYFQKIHNIGFSCFGDDDYPSSLYHLENPPSIFYYSGDLDLVNKNYNLSLVGTRNSSLYGEHCCRSIVESLEDYDVSFISGLARGIDLTSHKAALSTGANSIAVIGSGLLAFAYAGEQKVYFEELKRKHLVISELHPREHASRQSFAIRNRLIAALSNSTVVVEAPVKSGALITADYCLRLDRNLYVIPGDLNKKSFEGSNKLLAENKAQAIFQASKTPYILGLDYYSAENSFIRESKTKQNLELDKIKNTIQEKVLKPYKKLDSDSRKTPEPKKRIYKKQIIKDPLIDLLDSGINDFDLLLFKSHYQSQTELISHLTDLEIQGKISRKGALFVAN